MKYSVVVPLKDEESNIEDLVMELKPVMHHIGQPWELICIDDGSKDRTLAILKELQKSTPELRIITFTQNFGQSSAFDAGFRAARGEFVITMDGDRQNDPRDIPKLIGAINGFHLVCGQRVDRQDPWSKKVISKIANAIRSRVCEDGVTDTGCSLKLYRTECLQKIPLFEGMHRFLPALFLIHGYKVGQVPVNHRQRVKGETKYHLFNRSFNTIVDMWAVRWMKKRHLHYEETQNGS